jgi:multimeric flavodoxin WrbA
MAGREMKVLGILGSPRIGGASDTLLSEFLSTCEEKKVRTEKLVCRSLKISPCVECYSCHTTGDCAISDDMQKVYPALLESQVIVIATPVFFYSVPAWLKALIDRTQALWARKYILKRAPPTELNGRKRKGYLICVGGTGGERLFDGITLTVKYFFDTTGAQFILPALTFRKVEGAQDIIRHPSALSDVRKLALDALSSD